MSQHFIHYFNFLWFINDSSLSLPYCFSNIYFPFVSPQEGHFHMERHHGQHAIINIATFVFMYCE